MDIYKWYKASRVLYLHHIPILPGIIKGLIRVLWAAVIPYQADIGEGTVLGYQGLGIVIHKRCVIGKNCHISQNITLGGTSDIYEVPVVGDDVTIGAGASIIGPVKIGNHVIIGAGAVVITDIPANSVAVGVSAKVVKRSYWADGLMEWGGQKIKNMFYRKLYSNCWRCATCYASAIESTCK